MMFGAPAITNLVEGHAQVVATAVQYISEFHQHWMILHLMMFVSDRDTQGFNVKLSTSVSDKLNR